MKTTFTARHFEARQELQDYCRDYVQKLDQFYDRIVVCDIILEQTSDPETPSQAQLIIKVPKKVITVTEKADTYKKAIHEAVDTGTRLLKRYKQKMQASN